MQKQTKIKSQNPTERWRPLTRTGFPDKEAGANYQVSNLGRIRSLPRIEHMPYKDTFRTRRRAGTILQPAIVRGYLKVQIFRKAFAVHRLVALAFIGPPPFEKAVVRHKDDDKENCRSRNLCWGSHQDNSDDMTSKGRQAKGQDVGTLTDKQVLRIKRRLHKGEKPSSIALDFPRVSECAIYDIRAGRSWKHLTLGV